VNLAALWHDLECGDYEEDLRVWRLLAAEAGGEVLDVGAGTGRVTLDLARRGVAVVALDVEAELLEALRRRAAGLPVETLVADARSFALGRSVSLVVVPMQTLQLLGGREGRAAFLRCALAHLRPGGIVAAAVADAMDCFDDEHALPPPADARVIAGVRYASQLLSVAEEDGRAAIHRRREIDGRQPESVVVRLDRVSADEIAVEAREAGFALEPHRQVPESEHYLGSTVVVARRPLQPRM
jgi:SAM-dependent methyltransferase